MFLAGAREEDEEGETVDGMDVMDVFPSSEYCELRESMDGSIVKYNGGGSN